ncbi:MAG TPA: zinc-binding dehydrogenase [Fluviicoccus sp.]|nr:zinc-binding dehydrogenase [Fluviicoccus sp.]
MKAVVCKDKVLSVAERPEPVPAKGQLLVKVIRCGICGSDLHVRQHCDHWGKLMVRSGYTALQSSSQEVVFGHEFSAEVLDTGPRTRTSLKPGTPIVAVPMLRRGKEIDLVGLSAFTPGAYAERTLVEASLAMAIPNGLSPVDAALTEPLAVAWHAVLRGEVKSSDVAIVIGCGPVGLAIICLLKARGVREIVASDFSPVRRAMAERCGATRIIDPSKESPFTSRRKSGFIHDAQDLFELAVGTKEKLDLLPVPWWPLWAAGERIVGRKHPVVFECVGAPGILQSIIDGAPMFTRVVVVGVCMQPDTIEPAVGINKELDIRFALGYTPLEFRQALHMLAEGEVDASPLVTATVGLGGVDAAFTALGQAGGHAKILIDPASAVNSLAG